jgi:hypothetical protein
VEEEGWQEHAKTITAPIGAENVALFVYSYATDNSTEMTVRYDDFALIELPNLLDRFWLVEPPPPHEHPHILENVRMSGESFQTPRETNFEIVSPTKKKVEIRGAATPFFLSMSEAYHPQWQLLANNEKVNEGLNRFVPWTKPDRVPDEHHFSLASFLNGWYVDVNSLCRDQSLCTQNADGTYDISMVVEFWPQRWFYVGLVVSGATLLFCIGYLVFDFTRSRRRKKKEQEIMKTFPASTPTTSSHS